jgi:hypothetical protein
LNSSADNFSREIQVLKESTGSLHQKEKKIKELNNLILQNQLKIEELFKENYSFLEAKLSFNVCQIKQSAESLLETIGSFTAEQLNNNNNNNTSSNNSIINNTSLMILQNFSANNLMQTYNQFKSKFQIEKSTNLSTSDVFTNENKALFEKLFHFCWYKDQKSLFDQFLIAYKQLKRKLVDLEKFCRNKVRYDGAQQLALELNNSVDRCCSIENTDLFNYVAMIEQNIKNLVESKQDLTQV